MIVKKRKLSLKCDTDGCDKMVEREIYLNGKYAQVALCEDCIKELYDALVKEMCDTDKEEKNLGKKK